MTSVARIFRYCSALRSSWFSSLLSNNMNYGGRHLFSALVIAYSIAAISGNEAPTSTTSNASNSTNNKIVSASNVTTNALKVTTPMNEPNKSFVSTSSAVEVTTFTSLNITAASTSSEGSLNLTAGTNEMYKSSITTPLSVDSTTTSSSTSSNETKTSNVTALPNELNQLTSVASTFTSAFDPSRQVKKSGLQWTTLGLALISTILVFIIVMAIVRYKNKCWVRGSGANQHTFFYSRLLNQSRYELV